MKRKIAVALAVLGVGAGLGIPLLAVALHHLLSRQPERIALDLAEAWRLVLGDGRVRTFYWLLLASLVLTLAAILLQGTVFHYDSKLQQVTPEIKTPYAAGQGQYGTARWMTRQERDKVFSRWQVKDAPELDKLLEAGRKDQKEVRHEAR